MNLSILLLVLGIIYTYLLFVPRKHEHFDNKLRKGTTQETIFDEFYVFLLDDLFYSSEFFERFCKIILHYSNSVYNNHLCIGIKHGGHINEILKENASISTISKSKSIIDLCQYNYKNNNYQYIDKYETNSYIFNDHEFTHISLIDSEIYYTTNLNGLIYNISRWLSNRGYFFIDVFQNVNDLKKHLTRKENGRFIKLNYKYSDKIKDINDQKFYFIEHINIDKEEKVNHHEVTYYSNEYLKHIAKECDLSFVKYYDTISHVTGRGVIVFQKL